MNYGPEWIVNELRSGRVRGLTAARRRIAIERWKVALDAARNAARPLPILGAIQGKRTALVVVDMQRAFLDEGSAIEVAEGRGIVAVVNRLAAAVRKARGLVIYLRYIVDDKVGLLKYFEAQSYLGGNRISPMEALRSEHPQSALSPELEIGETDVILEKRRFSAVLGSSIEDVLQSASIRNVIVTGVTTDVCAGNTAECLMQRDYYVVMVWDATAALDRLEHELYLARIFGLYGDVMSGDEVIRRLC